MQATEILNTFKKLGVNAYVNGDKLVCEPGSKLPRDLLPEIREHKAEIMALLSQAPSKKPTPEEETLLKYLLNGQRWLTAELEKWSTDKPDAASDNDFQKALDGWVAIEAQLREQHGYLGCIHGEEQQCPGAAIVNCTACAGTSSNKETRHGANIKGA
jgi:hypothetical protein